MREVRRENDKELRQKGEVMILECSRCWAIHEPVFDGLIAIEDANYRGVGFSGKQVAALLGLTDQKSARHERRDSIAIIPVIGVLTPNLGFLGRRVPGRTMRVKEALRDAMEQPRVNTIVFDFDTPGGATEGIEELADEIYAARSKKRIIAHVNTLAASAGYWLASQAHEIVISPSGHTGSIGVLGTHMDFSEQAKQKGIGVSIVSAGKYKAEASEFTPLTAAARQSLQRIVDDRYDAFVRAVARGRKTSQRSVRDGFGEGRVVTAKEALSLGMADKVESFWVMLERLTGRRPKAVQLSEADRRIMAELELMADLRHLESVARLQDEQFERLEQFDPRRVLRELEELER